MWNIKGQPWKTIFCQEDAYFVSPWPHYWKVTLNFNLFWQLGNSWHIVQDLTPLRLLGSGEGVKEKLVPLIQGPSDTKDLHMSRWLNEIRKPESLLAPDLLVFSIQVPQQGEDCRNSGKKLHKCFKYMHCTFSSLLSFSTAFIRPHSSVVQFPTQAVYFFSF